MKLLRADCSLAGPNRSFLRRCLLIGVGLVVANCSTVPPLDQATGGIPVRDIVQRVKCEITDAFDKKTQDPKFRWMKTWTAKVDLTLVANAQAGVSPGASLIAPLKNAYPAVGPSSLGGTTISAVKQQFSFSASANLNEQAIRTELISFSLALDELKVWREKLKSAVCRPSFESDLAGSLGLKEWIDEALTPVSAEELQAGDHPPPSSAKSTTSPPPSHAAEIGATLKDQALKAAKDAAQYAKDAQNSASTAATAARQAHSAIYDSPFFPVLDPGYKRLSISYVTFASRQADQAKKDSEAASNDADKALSAANQITDDPATSQKDKEALQIAVNASQDAWKMSQDAKNQADAASKNASFAKKRQPNPPIDSISHSVQFIITYGFGASPSWTLVNVSGPNGNLIAASGIRTHTLNIALGPRGPEGGNTSQEAVRLLTNLTVLQSGPH